MEKLETDFGAETNGYSEFPDDTGIVSGVNFQTIEKEPEGIENFVSDKEAKRSLAQNPLFKVGIAATVAVVFLFIGFQTNKHSGEEESTELTEAEAVEEELTLSLEEGTGAGEVTELAQAQAELALLQQQISMEEINRTQLDREVAAAEARRRQGQGPRQISAQPDESVRPRPATRPAPTPTPPPPRAVAARPETVALPPVAPGRQQSRPPTEEIDPIDPIALWNNKSQLGVIGGLGSPYMGVTEEPEEVSASSVSPRFSDVSLSATVSNQGIPGIREVNRRGGAIPLGRRFKGEATVAIPWIDTADRNRQNYLIRLEEPLLDNRDNIAIPEEAFMIVQTNGVNRSSGYAELSVIGYQLNDEIYELPIGVISVNGEDGDLLIAERYTDGGGGGELASLFGLGALSGVGDALDGNSTTIDVFSTGATVSSTSGDGDVFGSAIGGGADAVIDQYSRRAEQNFEDRQKREAIFYLSEGYEVEFYVTQEFVL